MWTEHWFERALILIKARLPCVRLRSETDEPVEAVVPTRSVSSRSGRSKFVKEHEERPSVGFGEFEAENFIAPRKRESHGLFDDQHFARERHIDHL